MALSRKGVIEFMFLMGKLKSTPRTGWVRCGIRQPESIADHMYRMATLAFLSKSHDGLEQDRCIKLCLVHDMAESIVGDLTPHDNISDEEKHRREQEAMDHIKGIVGDEVGQEFYDLWQEYEDQTTREAKFVKDLDKFDMIFQAFEYESAEKRQPEDLEQFFTSCQGKFQTDLVRGWVDQLNSLRAAATFNSRRQLDGGDLPSTTSKDILKQTDGGNDTSSSSS